jgi:ribosomal protein S18 acetylase RimI-like enzyme
MMDVYFSIIELGNTDLDRLALYDFLVKMDGFYTPRISSRVELAEYSLKLLSNAKVFCALSDNHECIGLLAIYVNSDNDQDAFISFIGVMPEYHGKGLSSALMDRAIDAAVENGMRSISLEVSVLNPRAINFYKKHGFIENYKTIDAMFMKKMLEKV